MPRLIGTVAMGLRAPIVKKGDDLVQIVGDIVEEVAREEVKLRDKDVVAITESLLARSQGNYASIEQIAKDFANKFDNDEVAILFPILSRNRFSILLKAFALSGKKLHICLSYPSDEVGNLVMDEMDLFNSDINAYTDVLSLEEFRKVAGDYKHLFTEMDYPEFYREIAKNSEIHFLNNPVDALKFTDNILVASIHTRNIVKRQLVEAGAKKVLKLDEILTESVDGSGFNPDYGLLGSNLSTGNVVKLFPRNAQDFVNKIQKRLIDETGKHVEVMVYGDGAFKDPVGHIWELADPVVSPGFTDGLTGTPYELKLKYVADNDLSELSSEEAAEEFKKLVRNKDKNTDSNKRLGTTPRQITDLLGSLSDLISGSGDKGTPVVLIQGYFDNYSND
ncbi:coenzyme F420-0:L-glutamate ligase [Anaerococcus lactolyticus]|uniref:F420-0--gamma-glutamyl ligase n=1 Tax=Anaerococcus lactolyticus S7-1-13 TaxID=1284686 RepID=A0A095X4T2_9FIRM|nr:coenzyme F420-0:L-glutamate ligase [Anaerococcus lactolyticus]KGF04808.1 F420-0--gamma-glutamyl ligase [Anaerococcus lactolyticus S7-1-13]